MDRFVKDFGLGWIFCGALVALGLFFLAEGVRIKLTWQPAVGKVVGHGTVSWKFRTTKASAIVKFRTPEGRVIHFESRISTSSKYGYLQQVPVRFRPDRPTEAEIDSFDTLFFSPVLFLGLGVGLPLTSLGLWLIWDRRPKQWLPPPTTKYRSKP
ncbi:MAG: DUF3592 domain-containing protein [Capsulimonadales bacterium]|nr:DUF3592 domain-containing protein [Capsulimonadales bacterium]